MIEQLTAGFNQIIVKEVKPTDQTKAGLYIPESNKDYRVGEIIRIGYNDDKYNQFTDSLKKYACFGKYAGVEFEFEGTKYLSVKLDDIIATMDNSN